MGTVNVPASAGKIPYPSKRHFYYTIYAVLIYEFQMNIL